MTLPLVCLCVVAKRTGVFTSLLEVGETRGCIFNAFRVTHSHSQMLYKIIRIASCIGVLMSLSLLNVFLWFLIHFLSYCLPWFLKSYCPWFWNSILEIQFLLFLDFWSLIVLNHIFDKLFEYTYINSVLGSLNLPQRRLSGPALWKKIRHSSNINYFLWSKVKEWLG